MDKELEQLQQDLNVIEKQDQPVPKILIGVPILAWTHDFALSFLNFWTELMTYNGRRFHVGFEFRYRRPVHLAEEELAQHAIDVGCTHLLLMDDDIFNVTAQDLFTLLDADKDVVGGIMHTNGFPYTVCAFRRFDHTKSVAEQPKLTTSTRLYEIPLDQRTGVQPVDLIPFGFTLIKTSVFNKIPKPWFKCDADAPTDSWFADSVLDAGLEYFAHFGVWLNHNGTDRFNVDAKRQLGFAEMQRKNAEARIVGLTPEEMSIHDRMIQQKMEQAEEEFRKRRIDNAKFYTTSESGKAELLKKESEPLDKSDVKEGEAENAELCSIKKES